MGDFNARVGLQESQTAGDVIVKHTIDQQNENGQLLVDCCFVKNCTSVHDVRAHRGAAGAIGTDYHLLRAKIPIPVIDKAEETRQDTPPSCPEVVQSNR
ncbi:unnamed protein product [Didymodactylos carnosus]|uniref:Uncharacterized protein n=1 Tax=Didymodactylos carnosus TaxID=1234261 RepID=A0A815X3P4_9BILA|nr:unnamed protein product [Didymodactylos carnosus]CAF1553995.1 unnamed protein product [Didymodactylos carnosus]CAF4228799.1 unnamed protein product [Didymodactylos carnosus]CAF4415185.1 unnamed protein product [Didymodactylos carnosus]